MSDVASESAMTITVTDTGPYLVAGDVPLVAKTAIETDQGEPIAWQEPEPIEHRAKYSLCRCGASANKPFCDGAHKTHDWDPTLNPPAQTYDQAATSLGGDGIEIKDDRALCVHAGFCGNKATNVWDMADQTGDTQIRIQAIAMIENCPSGALTYEIAGTRNEPELAKAIAAITDGPLWVQDEIPVELPDGSRLEARNRVTLCRCGESKDKPLCDGSHKAAGFRS